MVETIGEKLNKERDELTEVYNAFKVIRKHNEKYDIIEDRDLEYIEEDILHRLRLRR